LQILYLNGSDADEALKSGNTAEVDFIVWLEGKSRNGRGLAEHTIIPHLEYGKADLLAEQFPGYIFFRSLAVWKRQTLRLVMVVNTLFTFTMSYAFCLFAVAYLASVFKHILTPP
jgi:hypothetical protein